MSIGDTNAISTSALFVLVKTDKGFKDFEADGILGLGFKGLSNGNLTLMDNLKNSGKIASKQFAMYINFRDFDGTGYGNPPSNLMIGTSNITMYSSNPNILCTYPIDQNAVTNEGFWQVNDFTVSYNGAILTSTATIIFDSGTSYIYIPTVYVDLALASLLASGFNCELTIFYSIGCKCKDRKLLPDIQFNINTQNVSISQNRLYQCDSSYCEMLIYASDDEFWLLGDVFLRQYYTIYNMDAMTISFTPAINNTSNATFDSSSYNIFLSIAAILAVLY